MPALSTPGTRFEIGDLVAYLDDDGSFLRAISVAGEEILRGIGFVVRDQHWGTYKLQSAPEIERSTDGIAIRVTGHIESPDGTLDWSLVWTLRRNGLSARCDCTSAAGFPTNRTGFVVLHSLPAARGQSVAITHDDGQVEETRFPDLVSPISRSWPSRRWSTQPPPAISFACDLQAKSSKRKISATGRTPPTKPIPGRSPNPSPIA
jgi:hypothetical protein